MADLKERELTRGDLTTEEYREYDFIPVGQTERVVYRINNPVAVYFYKGCSTHRVEDADGIVHCVPAIGSLGCVVRWKVKAGAVAVSW